MSAITVTEGRNLTTPVNSNTRSEILRLNPGKNRVGCYSAAWNGTKQAALRYFPVPDSDAETDVKDADGNVAFLENDCRDIPGPGFVCFDLTGSDGDAVTLYVLQIGIMD